MNCHVHWTAASGGRFRAGPGGRPPGTPRCRPLGPASRPSRPPRLTPGCWPGATPGTQLPFTQADQPTDTAYAGKLHTGGLHAAQLVLELLDLVADPRGDLDLQLGRGGVHLVGELGDEGHQVLARGTALADGLARPGRVRPGPRGEAVHGPR